jgi:Flp pilus assembly protein TadD
LLLTVDSFWGVFWVDVSSKSTADAGFLRISDVLGSPVQNIDDARHLLSNVKHNWLLVLDNADDPDTDYERYFPSGTRGAILMTSRVPECSCYNTVGFEQLESLSSAECLTLLLRAAEIQAEAWAEHEPAAKYVVSLLGSHTLALIQAGAYIARGFCSLGEYPTEYSRQCERLLKFSPKQAQSRYCNIYATFEVSAQVLESSSQEADRDALELLQLLVILHYNNVPLVLFEDSWKGAKYARQTAEGNENIDQLSKSHVSQLPQFIPVDLHRWEPFRLRKAQAQLQSLALLRKGKEGDSATVLMHSLTHTWTNIRQNQVRKRQSWRVTGCILALSYYGYSAWRPYRTHLDVHLQSFFNADSREIISSGSMEVNQMLFQCGWLLDQLRMDSTLQELLRELFGGLGMNPVEPLEALLPLYKLLSRNLYNMGKAKEAVKVLERMGHLEELKLAEDHPDQLASQHELAIAYDANGQVKEAVQLLEHVVKVEETTLAEDHPDRLASQHALAIAYDANGQVTEAVQLLEHVVKVKKTTLAEDHPDRLASQHALAIAYDANGQVKEAVQLLEHVVKVKNTTLAEDHPSRLASQHALGIAYQEYEKTQSTGRSTFCPCYAHSIKHFY